MRENLASEQELPRRIVENTPEEEALAAVETLGKSRTSSAVAHLSEMSRTSPSRRIRKAARRMLHRLETVGIRTEEQQVIARLPADYFRPVRALASPIDSSGERMVWVVLEHQGGLYLLMAHLTEATGIKECSFCPSGRQKLIETIRDAGSILVEVDPAHAIFLLREARETAQRSGTTLPQDFQDFERQVLEKIPPMSGPLAVYRKIAPEQLRESSRFLRESAGLLALPEFTTWVIPPEALKETVARFRDMKHGPIMLPDHMLRRKEEEAHDQALQSLFSPATRTLFQRRMEEMAYVLWESGKSDNAQRTLAVAVALQDGRDPAEIPFLSEFFDRSLEAALKQAGLGDEPDRPRGEEPSGFKRSGPIYTP